MNHVCKMQLVSVSFSVQANIIICRQKGRQKDSHERVLAANVSSGTDWGLVRENGTVVNTAHGVGRLGVDLPRRYVRGNRLTTPSETATNVLKARANVIIGVDSFIEIRPVGDVPQGIVWRAKLHTIALVLYILVGTVHLDDGSLGVVKSKRSQGESLIDEAVGTSNVLLFAIIQSAFRDVGFDKYAARRHNGGINFVTPGIQTLHIFIAIALIRFIKRDNSKTRNVRDVSARIVVLTVRLALPDRINQICARRPPSVATLRRA